MTERKASKPQVSAEMWIKLSMDGFKDAWLQIPHHGTREYKIRVGISLLKLWRTNWRPEFEETRPAVAPRKSEPPIIAESLLIMFAPARRADHVIGDLEERFTRECEELGRRRAVCRYWARTLHSLWPLLRRAIGKALKWGAVIDTVRRHL
jgi:hypothetical protein